MAHPLDTPSQFQNRSQATLQALVDEQRALIADLEKVNTKLSKENADLSASNATMRKKQAVLALQGRETNALEVDDKTLIADWRELRYMLKNWALLVFDNDAFRKDPEVQQWVKMSFKKSQDQYRTLTGLGPPDQEPVPLERGSELIQAHICALMCCQIFGDENHTPYNAFAGEQASHYSALSNFYHRSSLQLRDKSPDLAPTFDKEYRMWRVKTTALFDQSPYGAECTEHAVTKLHQKLRDSLGAKPKSVDMRYEMLSDIFRAAVALQATFQKQRDEYYPHVFAPQLGSDAKQGRLLDPDSALMEPWNSDLPFGPGSAVEFIIAPALMKVRDGNTTCLAKAVVTTASGKATSEQAESQRMTKVAPTARVGEKSLPSTPESDSAMKKTMRQLEKKKQGLFRALVS